MNSKEAPNTNPASQPAHSITKIYTPEEIAAGDVKEPDALFFPDVKTLFASRAERLRQLAVEHPMADFLKFASVLSDAQQTVLSSRSDSSLPTEEALGDAVRANAAPLSLDRFDRNSQWREDLQALLANLESAPSGLSTELLAIVAGLRIKPTDEIERQADRLLLGNPVGLDLATAPLIGAALQVYYSRLVATTQATFPDLAFDRLPDPRNCPCCASPPTASIYRNVGRDNLVRYLHCSLCQTEWHVVRISCSNCGDTKSLHYEEAIPEQSDAQDNQRSRNSVRAECCDHCGHYLKLVTTDRDRLVDPIADDLASMSLDLLVGEAGFQSHGHNMFLIFGASDVDQHPAPDLPQ